MQSENSAEIIFLGTGASNGTPGRNKSLRLESSILLKSEVNILIDVTRDFSKQAENFDQLDAVLITHAHIDASGGIPLLNNFQKSKNKSIQSYAHRKTIKKILHRYKKVEHCRFHPISERETVKIGSWIIEPLEIPHSFDPDFPTLAWKLTGKKTIVYASDIATLKPDFKKFCEDADFLIVDGATWKRKIFTHLRIDTDLPILCKWNIKKIFLTQIGKSVPVYEKLLKEVSGICPKAFPAYDGMVISI